MKLPFLILDTVVQLSPQADLLNDVLDGAFLRAFLMRLGRSRLLSDSLSEVGRLLVGCNGCAKLVVLDLREDLRLHIIRGAALIGNLLLLRIDSAGRSCGKVDGLLLLRGGHRLLRDICFDLLRLLKMLLLLGFLRLMGTVRINFEWCSWGYFGDSLVVLGFSSRL